MKWVAQLHLRPQLVLAVGKDRDISLLRSYLMPSNVLSAWHTFPALILTAILSGTDCFTSTYPKESTERWMLWVTFYLPLESSSSQKLLYSLVLLHRLLWKCFLPLDWENVTRLLKTKIDCLHIRLFIL